jgi:hypothetical protein
MCPRFGKCVLYLLVMGTLSFQALKVHNQIHVLGNSALTAERRGDLSRSSMDLIHGRKDNEEDYKIIHDSTERTKKGKEVFLRPR